MIWLVSQGKDNIKIVSVAKILHIQLGQKDKVICLFCIEDKWAGKAKDLNKFRCKQCYKVMATKSRTTNMFHCNFVNCIDYFPKMVWLNALCINMLVVIFIILFSNHGNSKVGISNHHYLNQTEEVLHTYRVKMSITVHGQACDHWQGFHGVFKFKSSIQDVE